MYGLFSTIYNLFCMPSELKQCRQRIAELEQELTEANGVKDVYFHDLNEAISFIKDPYKDTNFKTTIGCDLKGRLIALFIELDSQKADDIVDIVSNIEEETNDFVIEMGEFIDEMKSTFNTFEDTMGSLQGKLRKYM